MNIYIGNLNYRVQEDNLRKALEEYGDVSSVKLIKDRDTGRSKGYAFAEMPNDHEAHKAISELNESQFEGRQLVIKQALPKR
ncbi:MAG: RNA-binding protein [Tannerella sp.]|jgi:RNA recognition motif-containing protein|nr:RNA-binding protein [Tannerella sp.]